MDYSSLKRNCVYTEFLHHCNKVIPALNDIPFSSFNFDRKWAKYTLMTHFYSAGLKTASRLVTDWVNDKISPDLVEKYENFFSKYSRQVKEIRVALLSFCPWATLLNNYFRKVALITVCNEQIFSKLKKDDCNVILEFRNQLFKAGLSETHCDSFFGLGYLTLRILTPFGVRIEYSTVEKKAKKNDTSMQRTWFKQNSKSAFNSFAFKKAKKFDYKQLIDSFLVHFVHCCDAAILQKLTE